MLTVISDDEQLSEGILSPVTKDVYEDDLKSMCHCLDKIINMRVNPFDSTDLIESLFEKLTDKQASDMAALLYAKYFNRF